MRSRALVVCLIWAALSLFPPRSALAGAPTTWQGTIKGTSVWITVVPRGHDIPAQARAQEPWWHWGNTTTDAYLFAFDQPQEVRLILEFVQQPDGLPEARVYVNALGRERLDYSLQGDKLHVLSNGGYPYLIIRPEGGGWITQGRVNYRLSLALDGVLPSFGDHEAQTDGVIDVLMRVGGAQPGVPDWQTNRLMLDPHPTWGYPRLGAIQRLPGGPPFKVAPPLMPTFPYFDMGQGLLNPDSQYVGIGSGDIDWFKENPNPLYFNLRFSQLQLFPFPGFQNGGMYAFNSLAPPPSADFESPFGFYSFDPTTRYPQLVVRGAYFPVADPYVPTSAINRSSFRYSWKIEGNDPAWRYSLDVAGSYAYTQQVKIGDENLLGVSANELPSWVVSKRWPVATFVEAVDGYPSSEGIYFYTAQAGDNGPWLDGSSGRPPSYLTEPYLPSGIRVRRGSDLSLPMGFRGEYNATFFRQPTLYFSPIDNRLHLWHAQGGVWNLGDGRVLRTHNLTGGAYIDGWTREHVPSNVDENGATVATPGKVEEALYSLANFVIYSGAQGSELRQAVKQPSSFETLPPTDKATWQAFRERMTPYAGQERDPADLKSWLGALPGQTLVVTSGKIWDVRTTERGFRFAVDLKAGFQTPGLQAPGLKPGQYVMSYDGTWHIAPLTPPALSAALRDTRLTQLELGTLQVALRNDGQQDLRDATLEIWGTTPGKPETIVVTQTVALLAQTPVTSTLMWAAPAAGEWTLTPKIQQPDGRLISFAPIHVTVMPAPAAAPEALVVASTSPDVRPWIAAGLVIFAAIAALVFWQSWQTHPGELEDAA